MCGIAGIAGFQDPELLRRMTASLVHRGPDAEGFYFGENVSLGHRRLSIVDLERGGQPMPSADGRVWVSFNGQIYNHRELRRSLADDYPLRTECDTEILPALYAKEGIEMVHRLRGMFAFSIWDESDQTLHLVRDRIGVKPLYYAVLGDRLLFASEPKALLASPEVSREIDPKALGAYLKLLYIPPPLSIFRGVRQLPPGCRLRWKDGVIEVARYWEVPTGIVETRTEEEWAEEIEPILAESIRMRLMSDVPLGAFLSGGIDSSTIVSIMAEASSSRVKTFCVGFGEEGRSYEERPAARRIAEHFGTEHREMEIRLDVLDALESMVRGFDEPFGNPTAMLSSELARFTRENVTVALAGDGGDEVFGGYPRYQGLLLSDRVRKIPAPARHALLALVGGRESSTARNYRRWFRELLEGAELPADRRYAQWVGYRSDEEIAALLHPDWRSRLAETGPSDPVRDLFNRPPAATPLARAVFADLQGFLPENVLRYTDRMSMAHSLEVRVPYTDHLLVERMMAVPDPLKVKGLASKRLLRRIMKGRLPEEVLSRKKLGFNPPMGIWLQSDRLGLIDGWLNPDLIRRRGLFDPEEVRRIVDEHQSRRRDHGLAIWSLVVFEQWMRSYLD